MSALSDLQNTEQQEHADLVTLSALIPQILTAVANGTLDPTGAATLLTNMQGDDSTIKTAITSIQGALPTPAPAGS